MRKHIAKVFETLKVNEAKTAMVILQTVSCMKIFLRSIDENKKKIKELKSQQASGVHFSKAKANLEIPLGEIQLLVQVSEKFTENFYPKFI